MKQINVIKENCIGCGACVAIDPEHFEFDDDGKSSVITQENIESTNVLNAIESCPTSAIETIEKEGDNTETTTEPYEHCDCCNEDQEECDCEECHCEHCEHHEEMEENEN